MLVLSSRVREKIVLPEVRTTVEVVSIQSNTVRLGIDAPPEVRVLRESIPDRVAEWGPATEVTEEVPTLVQVNQLVERRLDVTREGLRELRRRLRTGSAEDVEDILNKLDEDLNLLRARLRREVARSSPRDLALCEQ
jgi:carbon storage regulator CsrA